MNHSGVNKHTNLFMNGGGNAFGNSANNNGNNANTFGHSAMQSNKWLANNIPTNGQQHRMLQMDLEAEKRILNNAMTLNSQMMNIKSQNMGQMDSGRLSGFGNSNNNNGGY